MVNRRTKEVETTQGTFVCRAMKHKEWKEFIKLTIQAQKDIEAGDASANERVEDFLLSKTSASQEALDEMDRWEIQSLMDTVKDLTIGGTAKN